MQISRKSIITETIFVGDNLFLAMCHFLSCSRAGLHKCYIGARKNSRIKVTTLRREHAHVLRFSCNADNVDNHKNVNLSFAGQRRCTCYNYNIHKYNNIFTERGAHGKSGGWFRLITRGGNFICVVLLPLSRYTVGPRCISVFLAPFGRRSLGITSGRTNRH